MSNIDLQEDYRKAVSRLVKECNDEYTLKRIYTILIMQKERARE